MLLEYENVQNRVGNWLRQQYQQAVSVHYFFSNSPETTEPEVIH